MPIVEQELLTLPKHLSSTPIFSCVHVTRSSVLCVCFVDRCLSFGTFPFGYCVFCCSSNYGFWLPFWYLQALLMDLLKTYHGKLNFSKFLHTFADDFLCRSFDTPSLVATDIFQDPKYSHKNTGFCTGTNIKHKN